MLRRAALDLVDADETDYERLDERLWRVAVQCGLLSTRLDRRRHHAHTKAHFVEKHGIEKWKDRIKAAKLRYRQRVKEIHAKEINDKPAAPPRRNTQKGTQASG